MLPDGEPNPGGTQPAEGADTNLQTVPIGEYKKVQSQYAGLQGHTQKLTNELNDAKSQISSLTQNYEAQISDFKSQMEGLNKKFEEATGQVTTLNNELGSMRHRSHVSEVIAKEFPNLMSAHMTGLLRTEGLQDEDLSNYLKTFSQFLSQSREADVSNFLSGILPPTPSTPPAGSGGGGSVQDLSNRLMNLTPDTEEYNQTMQQYVAALQRTGV
jgi:uncharacterized protein YukE